MNVINLRLEEELLAKLRKLAQLEHLDRTNLIRSLLRRGAEEVLMENALTLYSKGELSLEQASDLAEVSPWELVTMMVERGINHRGTADELRTDAKRRLEELGHTRLAGML